jgi:glutamine amidotransferase
VIKGGRIAPVAVLLHPYDELNDRDDMIAIIDYGMGNLRSVSKAFEAVGATTLVTRDPATIQQATHVVLPGVGAFGDCMANLERHGLVDPVRRAVADGKPFMGICLGLQVLFTESEEFGSHKGLGLIPGRVKRFTVDQPGQGAERLKVPHMGWNTLEMVNQAPPLQGIEQGVFVYFVHSYYIEPDDPTIVSSRTNYGHEFASSIWHHNIFACQFHPEKSQAIGLRIIKNFAEWRLGR